MQEYLLTKQGLEALQDELKRLKEVDRPAVLVQLKEARAQGDLSENADYDAARTKQSEIENRIIEIETMISNAKIIEEKTKSKNVKLGSTVEFTNLKTNKTSVYTIVGSVEADPLNGKISNVCPLGEALLNKSVGQEVDVKAKEPYKVRIDSIR